MRLESGSQFPTRRGVLALGGSGFLAGFPAWEQLSAAVVDFWNRKAPAEWSPEEIDRMLTKSPWAKEVNAQLAAGLAYPESATSDWVAVAAVAGGREGKADGADRPGIREPCGGRAQRRFWRH